MKKQSGKAFNPVQPLTDIELRTIKAGWDEWGNQGETGSLGGDLFENNAGTAVVGAGDAGTSPEEDTWSWATLDAPADLNTQSADEGEDEGAAAAQAQADADADAAAAAAQAQADADAAAAAQGQADAGAAAAAQSQADADAAAAAQSQADAAAAAAQAQADADAAADDAAQAQADADAAAAAQAAADDAARAAASAYDAQVEADAAAQAALLAGDDDDSDDDDGYGGSIFTYSDTPVFNYSTGPAPSAFFNQGGAQSLSNDGASAWNYFSNGVAIAGGSIQLAAGALLLSSGAGAPLGIFLIANGGASGAAGIANVISMATGDTTGSFIGNSGLAGFGFSAYQISTRTSNQTASNVAALVDLATGIVTTGVPFVTRGPNLLNVAISEAATISSAAVRIGANIGPNLANPIMTAFAASETLRIFQPVVSVSANAVGALNLISSAGDLVFSNSTGPAPNAFIRPLAQQAPTLPTITVPGLPRPGG